MKTQLSLSLILLFFLACNETDFSAGLENRVIAVIDMSPEEYQKKSRFHFR